MSTLTLLPAVDVTAGHAVQLVQGVAGSGGQYGDPMQAALAWQRAGASWIHLVDLDAAFGRGSNADLLADVVRKVDVQVEMSGGIRDSESLARALGTGCARVNIGTAALENPDWVRSVIARHGERIAGRRPGPGTPAGRPRLDRRGRGAARDPGPAERRGLRPVRGHRRAQGRHPARPEPGLAPRRLRAHDRAGGGQRRRVEPGRPAG